MSNYLKVEETELALMNWNLINVYLFILYIYIFI